MKIFIVGYKIFIEAINILCDGIRFYRRRCDGVGHAGGGLGGGFMKNVQVLTCFCTQNALGNTGPWCLGALFGTFCAENAHAGEH